MTDARNDGNGTGSNRPHKRFTAANLLLEKGSEEHKAEIAGLRETYKRDKVVLEKGRDLRLELQRDLSLKAISEASALRRQQVLLQSA